MVINRPELFLIPHETVAALSYEEVGASYHDMEELNLAYLPYPKTDIGISGEDWIHLRGNTSKKYMRRLLNKASQAFGEDDPDVQSFKKTLEGRDEPINPSLLNAEVCIRFENENLIDFLVKYDSKFRSLMQPPIDNAKSLLHGAEHYRRALIVLLATKNALKKRVVNKLAKLGIGKKKHEHLYVTTITIPPIENLSPSTGSRPGITLRPHLRRGHIRRQPYGPKRAFIKRLWIEPCFINADPDFISSRTAYNTSVTFPLDQIST